MIKQAIVTLAAAASLAIAAPAHAEVNQHTYDRVQKGWSQERVQHLFGKRGVVTQKDYTLLVIDPANSDEPVQVGTAKTVRYDSPCGPAAIEYIRSAPHTTWRVATKDGYFGRCG